MPSVRAAPSSSSHPFATACPSASAAGATSATSRGTRGPSSIRDAYQPVPTEPRRDPASCRAMADLLTIDEARALVLGAVTPLEAEELAIAAALGRVLAEDVTAAHDVPSFANSAMDGFAVRSGPAGRELAIVGESRAGTPAEMPVGDGEAVRISTGAAVPDGADAILPVEDADDAGTTVTPRVDLPPGHHI